MPRQSRSSPTNALWAALANPTRRTVLDLLASGPKPFLEIARTFDLTRPSVREHLTVLEQAGLVADRGDGRRRVYVLATEPLAELHQWLGRFE
jgi:DNA-binding transcriptional ArsR family regulator